MTGTIPTSHKDQCPNKGWWEAREGGNETMRTRYDLVWFAERKEWRLVRSRMWPKSRPGEWEHDVGREGMCVSVCPAGCGFKLDQPPLLHCPAMHEEGVAMNVPKNGDTDGPCYTIYCTKLDCYWLVMAPTEHQARHLWNSIPRESWNQDLDRMLQTHRHKVVLIKDVDVESEQARVAAFEREWNAMHPEAVGRMRDEYKKDGFVKGIVDEIMQVTLKPFAGGAQAVERSRDELAEAARSRISSIISKHLSVLWWLRDEKKEVKWDLIGEPIPLDRSQLPIPPGYRRVNSFAWKMKENDRIKWAIWAMKKFSDDAESTDLILYASSQDEGERLWRQMFHSIHDERNRKALLECLVGQLRDGLFGPDWLIGFQRKAIKAEEIVKSQLNAWGISV